MQVPVSAMMGGTVTVVTHAALSDVAEAVVLAASVDTITGTEVVISVQEGFRCVTTICGITGV